MYELLAEECVELAHASLKMARILRGENPTPMSKHLVEVMIKEEVTDVNMCLKDLEIYPDKEIEEFKKDRFEYRIEDMKRRKKNAGH